jgi:hypothetical protein
MELTQEHFDKGVGNLQEKIADIKAEMATKSDLKLQTVELKEYVHQAFETQQVWMEQRFGELIVK